jgi:hypothetical protein
MYRGDQQAAVVSGNRSRVELFIYAEEAANLHFASLA